jgi:hypothetical protein
MKRRVILEVVTPHASLIDHMPGGFAYADRMLDDQISQAMATDDEARWLSRCVYYLDRRFQRWLKVRFIEPFSLLGLSKVARYRIRTYPTFILGGETYSGRDLAKLEAFIRRQADSMADSGHTSS